MASDRIFMVLIVIMAAAILSVVILTVLQKKCLAPDSKFIEMHCSNIPHSNAKLAISVRQLEM